MSDVKGLIADARGYAKADAGYSKALLEDLADALEAATARTDREPQPGDGPDYHAEHASWLNRNRAVVEAQALEQAVDAYYSDREKGLIGNTTEWLLKRAVEIREGRQ